ncbi:hypothetical protein [Arthrobacter sp. USHLN218]|uniref:hypothetical protein n=1 Tax=Arthrobacter sp. USHLN218 TaxID=3081232 RepID=UPI003015DF9A
MRIKTLLKASALLAAAVVLGLLTVQGTYALWSRVVPVEAGTIQAANFRVTLTDVGTGAEMEMVDASGKAALLPLRPSGPVSSTVPAYAGVKVSNVTNAGSDFAVRARIGQASASYLVIKTRALPADTSNCGAVDFTAAGGSAEATLAKNASAVFCFQLALVSTAPQALSGTQTKITVPITADQL